MPKVLLIARDYPRPVGGIAHYISRTFSCLPPGDLVVIGHQDSRSGGTYGQRIRVIRTGRYSNLLRVGKLAIVPLIISTIRHVVRERDYELVVAEQVQTAIPALIAARLLGAKFIIFAYGMEITTSRWRGMKRWMFRQADRVITISAYSRILLMRLGVSPRRIGVIPPSIDVRSFDGALQISKQEARGRLGIAVDDRIMLSVAVLRQQYKGVDTAIRATSLLRERYPRLRYLIIGEGPDLPRLQRIVADLRLGECVEFVGSVDEAKKGLYYAACDLFMLPNRIEYGDGGERSEGFGIVFLEAALFGKPSIGGQGGSLDAVINGETGLSVSGTSVEEVAGAAAKLLDDPRLTEKLSEAGKRRAELEFSTDRVSERLEEECFVGPGGSKGHWQEAAMQVKE